MIGLEQSESHMFHAQQLSYHYTAKTIGDGGRNAASLSSKAVSVLDSVSTEVALVNEGAGVGGCVGTCTCNEGSEMLL